MTAAPPAEPHRYVEVAIPVPLRQAFTYRVPDALVGRLCAGSRVAVPFNRRKLAAVVLGHRPAPPPELKRVLSVAGLLDAEPVFPSELLSFLCAASDYYLHPIGEVLRAAAPALPTGSLRKLRDAGFLQEGESLPGRRVGTRTTMIARRTAREAAGLRLGSRQRAVLQVLDERSELDLDELRVLVREPRATLRTLAAKGLVELQEREVLADPFFGASVARDTAPEAHPAQRAAIEAIVAALRGTPAAFLLHGVTGSGKTEVYLQVIAEARARDRGAIVLVPEIALTPQLVGRFRARFGDAIAVLHSGLTDRERHDAWRRLRDGELRIAVGARSALFAPVRDLGILVVDEEHDPSFKQEEGFRYHARDMALLRAHRAGVVCVLGSATPSLESYYLAEKGRVTLLAMPERATPQPLPEVEVVDLRRHRWGPSGHPLISGPLHHAITRCLADGDQAILFLNRRGFAPSVRCEACSEVMRCPACSVALTEHRRAGSLRCHYCDFRMPPGESCPVCGARALVTIGLGTEQLEDTLAEVFAPARIGRLDRDTATGSGVERVLARLRRREIDILVGTQMVTKGHDVPGVTLVGVVLADQSLAFPDFRAAERTYQLLSQVAGRAGRGERPGRVILQTFQPGHHAVRHAAAHDYVAFYREELACRRDPPYAPFSRLVAVRVDAGDERRAATAARTLAAEARACSPTRSGEVEVLGPSPAPLARLRGRYRFRFLLRSTDRRLLRRVAAAVAQRIDQGLSPARATLDVDPVAML